MTCERVIIHFKLPTDRFLYFTFPFSHRYTHTAVRVSRKSTLTRAGIIARYVVTYGIVAACAWYHALVHILAVHLTVADVAGFALAQVIRGKIATFGIFDATPGERWIVAFVDICGDAGNFTSDKTSDKVVSRRSFNAFDEITLAVEAVASIARITGTLKAAKSICTVGKYITGSIFTLVLVCNF